MTFNSENAPASLNGVNTIFASVKQLQETKFQQLHDLVSLCPCTGPLLSEQDEIAWSELGGVFAR
jgi:hypothetical protein